MKVSALAPVIEVQVYVGGKKRNSWISSSVNGFASHLLLWNKKGSGRYAGNKTNKGHIKQHQ